MFPSVGQPPWRGAADPRTFRLGSTADEGTGQKWTLRIDRLSNATYVRLLAERESEIADGTWGAEGTSMGSLNRSPVTRTTVTRS